MKESRIDTCVECCVRDRDFSQKEVYRCDLCDRWFCERHIEPRLAFIRDLGRVEHSPEIRVLYYTEMQREDGHPDFEYSRRKFTELDIAEKERSQLIDDALDGMNAYFKTKSHNKGQYIESVYEKEPSQPNSYSEKPRKRRLFPFGKVIGVILAVMIIGALLWYAPTIISYIQTPTNPSGASYTSLTLRELMNHTATIAFGDTEYDFDYYWGTLTVNTFIGGYRTHTAHTGDTYNDFGIEVKVSNVTSDYVSNYIVIWVKPTVQNYMASLHYTKVNMTLYQPIEVNISSGLINKMNTYWFNYYKVEYPTYDGLLEIQNASQSKDYEVYVGETLTASDFNIEIRVFKVESQYMVIYVKPLF